MATASENETAETSTDVTAPIERVTALIALATDAGASEAEARTAAFQAVSLIREHALVVLAATEAHAARTAVDGAKKEIARMQRASASQSMQRTVMGAGLGYLMSKVLK